MRSSALLWAAVAMLAACAVPQLPDGTGIVAHRVQGFSWMRTEAQNEDLLYVSDEGGSVHAFSYPGGMPAGLLTGFGGPAGLCSDRAGDVFIADTPRELIYEYEHGGKKPISVIGAGGYPEGCAVDPKTGNFAVTNYQTAKGSGPGSVVVYTNLQKRASTTYTDQSFNQFFFCGYDDNGNLYVDGVNAGTSRAEFAELRRGGSSLHDFTLNKGVAYPGGIEWDGSYVSVEDLATDVLYRVKVAESSGTVEGTVHLGGDHNALLTQFWIHNGTIVLPYGTLARAVHRVGLWAYPSGGAPQKVLQLRDSVELFGATVSVRR